MDTRAPEGLTSNHSMQRMRASHSGLSQSHDTCRLTLPADAGRSPNMRAERAKLKSCKDDVIIGQGKRSAALGNGPKEGWVGWSFTQSGGRGGLAAPA